MSSLLEPYISASTPFFNQITDVPESALPSGVVQDSTIAGQYMLSDAQTGTPQLINRYTGELVTFNETTGGYTQSSGVGGTVPVPTTEQEAILMMGTWSAIIGKTNKRIANNTEDMRDFMEELVLHFKGESVTTSPPINSTENSQVESTFE
jgi:hypothetical protein